MQRWLRPFLVLFALGAAFCITFVWPQQNGLDFDIDTSPRAKAAKKRVPYDLSQVRVLKAVITKVNQNYVEPERIDHRRMLLAGLNAIQANVPPVLVHADADERFDDREPRTRRDVEDMGDSQRRTPCGQCAGTPCRGILDRHTLVRRHSQRFRGRQVRRRIRLSLPHLVTGHHCGERAGGRSSDHRVSETSPRHRHERAGNSGRPARDEQLRRSVAPREMPADSLDDAVEQPLHDLFGVEVDPATRAQLDRRVDEVEPDDRVRVGLRPAATELGDERVFALHPVRLGVDQRAVHVPQDGGRDWSGGAAARVGRRTVDGRHSWTSSIRVPKLPLGCTKATVVPRLPGRGAWSIAVAPAATIASSAAAQSSTR